MGHGQHILTLLPCFIVLQLVVLVRSLRDFTIVELFLTSFLLIFQMM